MKLTYTLIGTLLFAQTTLASGDDVETSTLATVLANLIPFFIIFGVVFFILRRVTRRNVPYMERAVQHMETIEKQNERIIELLEKQTEEK